MALSVAAIRQAKATGKAHTIPDCNDLSLSVSPNGRKSWYFRCDWLDKQKTPLPWYLSQRVTARS